MSNTSELHKQAAAGQSLGLRALHLLNQTRRGASNLKNKASVLSAGGIATGASAGYLTGGVEGVRESQMDAYKSGMKAGRMTKVASSSSRLVKIIKSKLIPKTTLPGAAKFLGTAAVAGGVSHLVTGALDRKMNNAIGNYGGINSLKKEGQ